MHSRVCLIPRYVLLLLCVMACPKAKVAPRAQTQTPKAKDTAKDTASAVATPLFHTVAKGETFYGISRSYRVPLSELLAANQMRESDILHVGQRLAIPQTSSSASSVANSAVAASELTVSNEAGGKRAVPPGVVKIVLEWPVKGMLYAKFGKKGKEVHDGIDLAAPLGTLVKAAAAGKVLYAGEQKGYGKIVIIEHTAGVVTLYAHNHELRTQTGAEVAVGDVIATVGQSGRTSGPHLHFELRKNGIPVDPLPYFK